MTADNYEHVLALVYQQIVQQNIIDLILPLEVWDTMKEAQPALLEENEQLLTQQTTQRPIYTTLNKIKAHSPDEKGWAKLMTHLGKTEPDDEPLKFATIVEANNVCSAIWALRSICPKHETEVRHFAAQCALRVLPIYEQAHPDDKRLTHCLDLVFAYCEGKADITRLQQMEDSFEKYDPDAGYQYDPHSVEKEVGPADYVVNAVEATVSPDTLPEMVLYVAAYADLAVNLADITMCGSERQAQAAMLIQYFS